MKSDKATEATIRNAIINRPCRVSYLIGSTAPNDSANVDYELTTLPDTFVVV